MMLLASVWLGLALLLSAYAWMASKRLAAVLLPMSVIVAAGALWVPTGTPRFTPVPQGRYTVIGADIQVDVAIFVLLKSGDMPPTYFKLPYTAAQANALQNAQDEAQGQPGSVKMQVGQDGGVSYDGPPPVTGEPPKQPERPALLIPE